MSPSNTPFPPLPLPSSISETYVHTPTNNLVFHVLTSGSRSNPLLLLVHGYPELAYSWRKVMPALAAAGYFVVAYDQRGYGRTLGWDDSTYARVDMAQFSMTNLVRDAVTLVHALGHRSVACIVGHDFGAVTASLCGLIRPDFFKSVVMMSHPYKEAEPLPFNIAFQPRTNDKDEHDQGSSGGGTAKPDIARDLAMLTPPRKHYKLYNSTAVAALQWSVPVQGLGPFLRGYFHVKSAAYAPNAPFPLQAWSASELAKMPLYYIMPLHASMPETIASLMAEEPDLDATKAWLSDEELDVYVQEWGRTGFQGGLNWYRTATDGARLRDLEVFAGKRIECPAAFVSGERDWGNYQQPGALERLPETCGDFRGAVFVEGAGHWPQQEQPERVVEELLKFLRGL
ncbi:epoxide hydrolase 2 [Corynespora cassiicola Philippines]|uniref:Epoxide hydrolase 2 n=1 Tax=Corynespora cassiicola Philippines TaxID=1448308 RepID=A0A2T2N3T4_CORCC|nr:epoxide hydrolase 2 [Corynespora cassiicola Philippines]